MKDVDAVEREIYRLVLFTLQRNYPFADRDRVGELFVSAIRKILPPVAFPALQPWAEAALGMLAEDGCFVLRNLLSADQVAETRRYFDARPCFNAHVPWDGDGVPRFVGAGAEAFHYGSYAMTDVLDAPHLLEIANHPQVLALAARYLGCVPTLYSVNAWWSFGGHPETAPKSQTYHRDEDDFRFCTLFIYLTDVDEAGGPHVFVRKTHRQDLVASYLQGPAAEAFQRLPEDTQKAIAGGALFADGGYGSDSLVEALFAPLITTIHGVAGTGILANTMAFHKGLPPRRGHRLMFWSRYGIYTNMGRGSDVAGEWRRVEHRLQKTDVLRYINRQILRDD